MKRSAAHADDSAASKTASTTTAAHAAPPPSEGEPESKRARTVTAATTTTTGGAESVLARARARKAELLAAKAERELQQQQQQQQNASAVATGGASGGTEGKGTSTDDKAQRLAALQARIAARMQALNIKVPVVKTEESADSTSTAPVPSSTIAVKKEEGREAEVDDKSRVLVGPFSGRPPEVAQSISEDFVPDAAALAAARRKRRPGLNFHEPGYYIQRAERERTKARRVAEQSEQAERRSATDSIPSHVRFLAQRSGLEVNEEKHEAEWWDKWLLPTGSYKDVSDLGSDCMTEEWNEVCAPITFLIEYPPREGAHEPAVPPQVMFLTDLERKKLRRNDRLEHRKQAQERVLMGLEEPPKPKVRLSNMLRVLGAEAAADPTAVEKQVLKETAARQRKHDERNAARKLTKEERAAKKRNKFIADKERQPIAALFVVLDLASDGRQRFKIEATAKKLQMTGCLLVVPDAALTARFRALLPAPARAAFAEAEKSFKEELQRSQQQLERNSTTQTNGGADIKNSQGRRRSPYDSVMPGIGSHLAIVIVEGGKKSIRKFEKLMLNRLQLVFDNVVGLEEVPPTVSAASSVSDCSPGVSDSRLLESWSPALLSQRYNAAVCVWSGAVQKPHFSNMRSEVVRTERDTRQLLAIHFCEPLWDLAVENVLNMYRSLAANLSSMLPHTKNELQVTVRGFGDDQKDADSVVKSIVARTTAAEPTDMVAQDVASFLDAIDDL